MKLFNILTLAYLLLIIADDFAVWCFNKILTRRISKYDPDELPKHVYRKVVSTQKVKRTTRYIIRVVQVLLLIPIVSALIVCVGLIIIKF